MSTKPITGEPKVDDIAVYINSKGSVVHLGRFTGDGRVKSRWGNGGLLCIHQPLDIPIYPGNKIRVSCYANLKRM